MSSASMLTQVWPNFQALSPFKIEQILVSNSCVPIFLKIMAKLIRMGKKVFPSHNNYLNTNLLNASLFSPNDSLKIL